jgi:hypothetical protein
MFRREVACHVCGMDDPLPIHENSEIPSHWAHDPDVKNSHQEALQELLYREFIKPDLSGDGIVYCGEGKYWPGIAIGITLLREHGCTLPVQVWGRGDAPELPWEGVTYHNISSMAKEHPWRKMGGWECKTYAIAHSGFARCLFLDADAYCVKDPTGLFVELNHAPFAYWKDLHCCAANVHWDAFGVSKDVGMKVPPVQGGQLLIDCQAFWRELMLTHWLCQHSDFSFSHGFGDQDQWRVALAATGQRYLSLGDAAWVDCAFNCSQMIVHRCRGKLFTGGLPGRFNKLPLERRVFELFEQFDPEYRQRYMASQDEKSPPARRWARQQALARRR